MRYCERGKKQSLCADYKSNNQIVFGHLRNALNINKMTTLTGRRIASLFLWGELLTG